MIEYSFFRIIDVMKDVERQMLQYGEKLNRIQHIIEQLAIRQREQGDQHHTISMLKNFIDTILVVVIVLSVQYFAKIWTAEPSGG